MTEDKKGHLAISKEMRDVEDELKRLGVPIDKIDAVLEYVDNYHDLNQQLQEARKKQFFNDAWNMARLKGSEKDSQLAEQLRAFAEHVVQMARDLWVQKPDTPIDEIVDLIPPMEKQDPYER